MNVKIEMIERDERVLLFAENHAEGVPWYHAAFEVFQETPYGFKNLSEFSNAPNRGRKTGSLLLINHWIETTPAPLPSNAEIVDAHDLLRDTARACRQIDGKTFPRYSFHETKTPCACQSPRVRIARRIYCFRDRALVHSVAWTTGVPT